MEVTGGQDTVLVLLGEKPVEDDPVLVPLAFDLFGEVFSLGAATDDVDPQAGERSASRWARSATCETRFCTTRRPRLTRAGSPSSCGVGAWSGCLRGPSTPRCG